MTYQTSGKTADQTSWLPLQCSQSREYEALFHLLTSGTHDTSDWPAHGSAKRPLRGNLSFLAPKDKNNNWKCVITTTTTTTTTKHPKNRYRVEPSPKTPHQAWIYTRTPWPLLPLVLASVPLQKFHIDFKISQWKCPFQNKNGLALSKMKF